MTEPPRVYLGDGVYASCDGWHIILTTGSHRLEEATNTIYLDASVLRALNAFAERVK